MKIFRFIGVLLFSAFIAFSLTACGSGGGGGDGSSGSSGGGGIAYTGATNQAALDDTNSEEITTSAYQGGSAGASMGAVGSVDIIDNRTIDYPRYLTVANILGDAFQGVDFTSGAEVSISGTVDSDTIPGDCSVNPGSMSYTINIDDSTGNFSGNGTFNSFCSAGVTLSGGVSFSGQVNTSSGQINSLNITFDSLTSTSGSDSFTMSGDTNFNFSASPYTATMNLTIRDNNTSEVAKIENFSISITVGSGYEDIVESGRFYHPVYGYVDISTPTPLRFYDGDSWPSSGSMVAAGSNSGAKLTVLSSSQYQVEVDNDGNGIYDSTLGPFDWSAL